MIITVNGIMIRTRVEEISQMGRNTQGVRVINLKEGDAIADVTRVVINEDEEVEASAAKENEEEADDNAEGDASSNGELPSDDAEDAVRDAE